MKTWGKQFIFFNISLPGPKTVVFPENENLLLKSHPPHLFLHTKVLEMYSIADIIPPSLFPTTQITCMMIPPIEVPFRRFG